MQVQISASDVKKLRDMTNAGMLDCKKALEESNGDFEAAIENLRKKGQKLSVKRADRDAKEGVVVALVSDDKKKGVVLRLSCETDFVSKNEAFVELTKKLTNIALQNFPADIDSLLALPFDGITIGEKVTEQVGVIGEKIEISDYGRLEADEVVAYIHMGHKAGVIVAMNKAGFTDAGKDVAMQIAAMKPIALDKDAVDASTVQKEIEIAKELARNEGKAEEMLEKIALGRLNKFYKESTLLNQEFVKNNTQSVRDYLQSVEKGLSVLAFKHIALG